MPINPILTCPYDKTHRVLKSRMPSHLVKCKRNFAFDTKKCCPFNTTHYVEAVEYESHVLTCQSSWNKRNHCYSLGPYRELGTVPLKALQSVEVPPPSENWNEDFAESYDPLQNIEEKKVLRSLILASKSKKRLFKYTERLRFILLSSKVCFKPMKTDMVISNTLNSPKRFTEALVHTYPELVKDFENLSLNDLECALLKHININLLSIHDADDKDKPSTGDLHNIPQNKKPNTSEYVENVLVKKLIKLIVKTEQTKAITEK